MRMMFVLALLVTGFAPVSAQTVNVRSGEHDSFTRFVIQIPKGTGWNLTERDRYAALQIDLESIRLDTGKVFARIPRKRVQSLRQDKPGAPLEFALNCNCRSRAFLQNETFLVVDITDQETRPADRSVLLPDNAYRFAPKVRQNGPQGRIPPEDQALRLSKPKPAKVVLPVTHRTADPTRSRPPAAISLETTIANRVNSQHVDRMEQRLLEQIDRAAGQGLVLNAQDAAPASDPGATAAAGDTQNAPRQVEHDNIKVLTVIDRDLGRLAGNLPGQAKPDPCMASEKLALHSWGTDEPFAQQISRHRANLTGEFDQTDERAVLSLAKTYLYFGFGAEAIETLNLLEAGTGQSHLLNTLAQVIDGDGDLKVNPFADQHACSSDAALWAVFSAPDGVGKSNETAVKQALVRLPPHLREHVGPKVSRIYANAGRLETADAILRSVTRVADMANPSIEMAQASVAELGGHTDKADTHRENVAHANSGDAPDALIELVRSKYEQRAALPDGTVDLIASYEKEYRGTELGTRLQQAKAVALSLAGDFDEAFETLGASENGADGFQATNRVLHLLTERSDDIEFLKHAFQVSDGNDSELPEQLGNKLARRFLGLGFPVHAVRMLSGEGPNGASRARRILRSKAALAQQLPREAFASVLGMEGEDADQLRARALEQMRDHERAAELLTEADRQAEAARNFWLTGNWRSISENPEERYSRLAGLAENISANTVADDMPPLARARALIGGSASIRNDVTALLEAASLNRAGSE